MKKINLILILTCLAFCATSQPLSWGKHVNTHNLPSIIGSDVFGDPVTYGGLRVFPDAVTTNEGNSNSSFDENSIFTIYSKSKWAVPYSTDLTYTSASDLGAWLIAKNQYGQTILSRRIKIDDWVLRVWSLQYNYEGEEEVLVFTGSVVKKYQELEHKMVVGTYNLNTGVTIIKTVNQTFNCEGETFNLSSQGVGVRELYDSNSNLFMAIGQSGDADNAFPSSSPIDCDRPRVINGAFYPIGVIFEVTSSGVITILHEEIKDFAFKPHTVSDPVNSTYHGAKTSMIVGGLRLYDDPGESLPPGGAATTTGVAPAAYTFDAVPLGGGLWQVHVDNNDGLDMLVNEYNHFGYGIHWPEIHVGVEDNYPQSRDVFLGFTDYSNGLGNPLLTGDVLFAKFSVNMSSGDYTLINTKKHRLMGPSGILEVKASVQRIISRDGDNVFDVVLNLYDVGDVWGRPNNTSIGLMSVPKSNLVPTSYVSVYADDISGEEFFETEIRNTTGLRVEPDDSEPFTYLLADGDRMPTRSARAHFNVNSYCNDVGIILNYNYQSNLKSTSNIGNKPSPNTGNMGSTTQLVEFENWWCEDYILPQQGFRVKYTTESENIKKPKVQKIGQDFYQIKNLEDNIKTYDFYSLSGQQVEVRMVNNTFSLQGLAPGMYILRYDAQNESHTEKLIVD